MTPCLDIHTHHPAPLPQAVVALPMEDFNPIEGQRYSVGIHPWNTTKMPSAAEWSELEKIVARQEVVAIGECGVDKLKGGPLFMQLIIFKKHIDLSEKYKKPLIIHDVKAHDVIVGLKKDYNPTQRWLVHGFRAKPTVAKMLTDAGLYLSIGEKFNPDALPFIPEDMLLAETDESSLTIEEIINRISESKNKDMTDIIALNTRKFLYVSTGNIDGDNNLF